MTQGAGDVRERVVLMYSGWQVWDGTYGELRRGEVFSASVEFVARSPLRVVSEGVPGLRQITKNRYQATATVLAVGDVVVLDLGGFRAVRWRHPGDGLEGFTNLGVNPVGTHLSLELTLSLNAWDHTDWLKRVDDLFATETRWRVEGIARLTIGSDDATEIDAASMELVDSADQYCLLDCTLLE